MWWLIRFDNTILDGQSGYLRTDTSEAFTLDGTPVLGEFAYTTTDMNPTPPGWATV